MLAGVTMRIWSGPLDVAWWGVGDGLFELLKVKGIIDHGSFLANPDLGAPFGLQLHDFPDSKPLQYALVATLGLASSDPATVANLFFLLGFPLVALSAFAVLRWLGVSPPVACACALLFALIPYHFQRNQQALFLAGYYGVPLGAALVLALYGDRRLFVAQEGSRGRLARWATAPTVATLLVCLAVGLLDLYYAAFTILMLVAATVIRATGGGGRRALVTGLVLVAAVTVSLLIAMTPSIAYIAAHGRNDAVAVRGPNESLLFSLNLASLTLPLEDHRLEPLARYERSFRDQSPVAKEEGSIGMVASLGFAWLVLVALLACAGARRSLDVRHRHLAAAALVAFVLATTGGLSALIAWGITPQIRTWSRVSVFIAFFSLAAVAVALDALRPRVERRHGAVVFGALLSGVVAIGVLDQTSKATIPDYPSAERQSTGDAALVAQAERLLPRGAMVFQLPYVPFPESPPVGGVGPYDLARPYLNSGDLRWSFGAVRGRPADWQASLAGAAPGVLLPRLAAAGFDAVYVDRRGFADGGRSIETELTRLTGAPVVGAGGQAALYDLRAYAAALRRRHAASVLARLGAETLHPVRVEATPPDFTRLVSDGRHAWRSAATARSELRLVNPGDTARTVLLAGSLVRPPGPAARVTLRFPDGTSAAYEVAGTAVPFLRLVRLTPGAGTMRIETVGFPLPAEPDDTPAFVQLRDLTSSRQELAGIR